LGLLLTTTALLAQGPAAIRAYQPGIDATHYSFTVIIPDSGRTIEVFGTVFLRRTSAADSLRLDLESPMRVRHVTLNAHEVTFARDAHSVRVALPKWNAQCATMDDARKPEGPDTCTDWVTVDAVGAPTDGLIITRDSAGRWLYFADHWPNRARNWLATIDHPSDKATVEWRVQAPSSLKVIANGRQTEESPLPNQRGRSITAWKTDIPIPVYLMTIGAAPMSRVDLGATACGLAANGGCVPQDVYEAPELAPRTPPGFLAAGRIVEWLSRYVAPFPYEKLSHVQSSTRFGGMENASAIFYASNAFRTMMLGEGLVAHETAHQWFGDAVTETRWADLWLSEGFATYFAALWERQARGEPAFRTALAGIRQRVLTDTSDVPKRPVIDTTQTDLMELLNRNSYEKGGFVLHMLRQEVGDSTWIRGIRAYYAAHRNGNATTDDLRAAIEQVSNRDFRWFFDQWLTRPGYPQLTVSWEYDETLTAHVMQAPKFGAYRLRLPVEIEDANGVISRTTLEVPASGNVRLTFDGRFTQRPRRVTFDPDGDMLAVFIAR
jgi:aminopeptidase N